MLFDVRDVPRDVWANLGHVGVGESSFAQRPEIVVTDWDLFGKSR